MDSAKLADSRDDVSEPMHPSHNNADGLKKRKISAGASSRGVANLTPDQLAKKRANDREAQRAIRERTKNQIESLEKEISELKTQHPYQEWQQALRQKDLVQAENNDIRQQLTSALSILQPILNERRANGDGPLIDSGSFHQPAQVATRYRETSGPVGQTPPGNLSTPTSIFADTASNCSAQSPAAGNNDSTRKASWHLTAEPHTSTVRRPSPITSLHQQKANLPVSGARLGVDFLLDGSQNATNVPPDMSHAPSHHSSDDIDSLSPRSASGTSQARFGADPEAAHIPQWSAHVVPIRNSTPTCPLDSLLLDFLGERRNLAATGLSESKLLGPRYPSIASLLYPERSIFSHPLSKVFTDILGTFPDLSSLPEQIAVLYIMFLVMRWQIAPTQENYDRLPDWVTPRPSQLFTPHPAWIDHLPWPRMRDVLTRDFHSYPFDNFFIPFTTTLSLNWPYEPTDTLISSSESDEVSINPVFERHLRNLGNWSLGPAFAKAFPDLIESVRIQPNVQKSWKTRTA
ncbi:MAG: hypothetical protein M1837_003126 [Sclerophora amabilis]|nr:MAG: hypothetical protein M1837_003126 [Sclerophora amabilis]